LKHVKKFAKGKKWREIVTVLRNQNSNAKKPG
jgi:hypothetical protein